MGLSVYCMYSSLGRTLVIRGILTLTVAGGGCLSHVGFLRTWLPFAGREILADDVLGHIVLFDLLVHDLLDNVRLDGLLGSLDGRNQFFGLWRRQDEFKY